MLYCQIHLCSAQHCLHKQQHWKSELKTGFILSLKSLHDLTHKALCDQQTKTSIMQRRSHKWTSSIFSGPNGQSQSGKPFCPSVVMNQSLKFFLENMSTTSSGLKRRGTIWVVIQHSVQKPACLIVWWCSINQSKQHRLIKVLYIVKK